jgi:acetyl-CoA carboxylase beta subunit
MKKLLILILAVGFIAPATFAQEELEPSKREKLQALKVGYLTEQLNLTPEEAQSFWPLYNELEGKMKSIRKAQRENRMNAKKNFETMSDAELAASIDQELAFEQQELDLKKEYNVRFKKILPIRKVAKLHASEQGFKRELLKGARDRRKIPGGPPH